MTSVYKFNGIKTAKTPHFYRPASPSSLAEVRPIQSSSKQLVMTRLTFLFILAYMSYAAASVITREDADLLTFEDELDEPEIRTIYGNATVPWEEGEVARLRVLSDLVKDLEFNCQGPDGIPEVCVRVITLVLLLLFSNSFLPAYSKTCAME